MNYKKYYIAGHTTIKRFSNLLVLVSLLFGYQIVCAQSIPINGIINGVSFTGPRYSEDLNESSFEEIKNTNANWVSITPEVILNRATLQLRPDTENHWWGQKIEGSVAAIKMAKKAGLKVMLKPQVILDNISHSSGLFSNLITLKDQGDEIVIDKSDGASWRGEISPDTEGDWLTWETSYTDYILRLATIAEDLEVDLFCIGTELKSSTKKRPEYWIALIQKVRKFYHGPITYSANWDEYKNIEFWGQLDFIGCNSYFPISIRATPSIKFTKRNWKYFRKKLKKLSEKHRKKLIITEFGYRNVSYAGLRPWIHNDKKSKPNDEAQANLYDAFFQSFWDQQWILGGFSWNWDAVEKDPGNTDFSIQGKPAIGILSSKYASTITKLSVKKLD